MRFRNRHSNRSFSVYALATATAGLALTGCSGSKTSPCNELFVLHPFVATSLAYPAPNAIVPAQSTTTLIFTLPVVPIYIDNGTTVLSTTPATLPSPLPAAIAMTDPSTLFAVGVPALTAGTTYKTEEYGELPNQCIGAQGYTPLGSFSTR